MAPRSKISKMPPEVRDWLEQALVDNGFSGYQELAELLQEKGFDISHAAVHRHGQKLARRLNAIKTSTEAAQLIAKAAPDSADNRSAAVAAMIQTGLFDALMDLQEADEMLSAEARIEVLSKASQGFAKLFAANLLQKKRADEIKAKLDALEAEAQKQGKGNKYLDLKTVRRIQEEIFGR